MEELASLGAEGAGDAADAGAGAGWPPQARNAARVRAVCVFFLGLDAPLCVLHPSHPPYHGQMDAALKSTFQKLDQHIRSLMARPPPQRAPPTSPHCQFPCLTKKTRRTTAAPPPWCWCCGGRTGSCP